MTRNLKTYAISLITLFMLAVSGCGSSETVNVHINDPIAVSGDYASYAGMTQDERTEQCKDKHIEVSGTLSQKYTSTTYYLDDEESDDFFIECRFEDAPEAAGVGEYLVVDGVCIYSFDDKIVLEGCQLQSNEKVERTQEEPAPAEIEEATEDAAVEDDPAQEPVRTIANMQEYFDLAAVPAYSGEPFVAINDNIPFFEETDMATDSYELYSDLDAQGRCGTCVACIGTDLMPVTERGEIGDVKPSGWNQEKYPGIVDGNFLYNRCHLIGYQLTGENDNVKNLITGTRYMNVEGMLPFENMVADYIKETDNHVMYRVTPVFAENDMLASGVLMEAKSVEDNGDGILFCVYCYNVQPGITIDYADGSSCLDESLQNQTNAEKKVPQAPEPSVEQSEESALQEEIEQPAPAPEPEQQVAPAADPAGGMVWISATGSKYHSINNCGRMNPDKASLVTEAEAKNKGLGKCSKCW